MFFDKLLTRWGWKVSLRVLNPKERDAESGLDYFLARYYSPAGGRFTSVDPDVDGRNADDPQRWNLYGYTSNNPLNRTDPNGERWFTKDGETPIWVDANPDGTYTSPGDGWKEWVPKNENQTLEIKTSDGYHVMYIGEHKDGTPSVAPWIWTGKVETKPEHIIAATAVLRIGIKAGAALWDWYQKRGEQRCRGIQAIQAPRAGRT